MDDFIELYDIYRSSTRWNVLKQIYESATRLKKATLWICKIAIVPLVVGSFFLDRSIMTWLIIALVVIYFVTFHHAKKDSFHLLNVVYPRRMKLFAGNYQYVKYENFKGQVIREGLIENIDEALRFVDYELGINQPERSSSQPVLALQVGLILAILGGAAGQWSMIITVKALAILIVSTYFTFIVLDANRGGQPGMDEFKKFLLWIREEKIGATSRLIPPSDNS